MIGNHASDIIEEFQLFGAYDEVLNVLVFLLGLVPITLLSILRQENVYIAVAFTTSSTDTLELFQIVSNEKALVLKHDN